MRTYVGLIAACLWLGATQLARANPETPYLSDGRSMALGGVGVASNDYASSVWQNPAGLASVKRLSVTGTLIPLLLRIDSPFPNLATGQPERVKGDWQLGGLGDVAAGYRVHERIVLGFTTYVFSGYSVKFTNAFAGQDLSTKAFAGEIQLPIAVNITKNLSLAAGYRMTFARISADVPLPPMPPTTTTFTESSTTLGGWNFAGVSVGIRYRFNDMFRAGFSYRNKVTVGLDGDTKVKVAGQTQKSSASGEYALPHTFKFGGELRLMQQRLVLASDFAVWLYRDSHPANDAQGRPGSWRNAVRGTLGAEYAVRDDVFVRGGFYLGNSATSDRGASQLQIGPSDLLYGFSAGAGMLLRETMMLDFALGYSGGTVGKVSADVNPSGAGTYHGHSILGCVSINYGI
ncbi:MAG: outer membrane protein transport protein [Myxococcales bacterium]